jgi:hypothetical protein
METFESRLLGIDQGEVTLFSDYENGGPMWTGNGPRARRHKVRFSAPFAARPAVHVSVTLWDFDQGTNTRADLAAERVTREGFEIVFRTWADTRVARIRVAWTALGQMPNPDDWQLS